MAVTLPVPPVTKRNREIQGEIALFPSLHKGRESTGPEGVMQSLGAQGSPSTVGRETHAGVQAAPLHWCHRERCHCKYSWTRSTQAFPSFLTNSFQLLLPPPRFAHSPQAALPAPLSSRARQGWGGAARIPSLQSQAPASFHPGEKLRRHPAPLPTYADWAQLGVEIKLRLKKRETWST